MEITEELRTLAKFTAGSLPVISVYLNTRWRDQHQRACATTFFERHLHQTRALEPETDAVRESLARDLERLTQWGQHHLQSPGERTMPRVALFACAAADLWAEFPSPLPFEDEFTVADAPIRAAHAARPRRVLSEPRCVGWTTASTASPTPASKV